MQMAAGIVSTGLMSLSIRYGTFGMLNAEKAILVTTIEKTPGPWCRFSSLGTVPDLGGRTAVGIS